jgi:hypothetical protein
MQNIQPQLEALPSFYYEDDFPLDDCTITLVKKEGQWSLRVYAPEKYEHKSPLESYRPYSLEECFYQLQVGRRAYAAKKEAFKLENRTAKAIRLNNSHITDVDLSQHLDGEGC